MDLHYDEWPAYPGARNVKADPHEHILFHRATKHEREGGEARRSLPVTKTTGAVVWAISCFLSPISQETWTSLPREDLTQLAHHAGDVKHTKATFFYIELSKAQLPSTDRTHVVEKVNEEIA